MPDINMDALADSYYAGKDTGSASEFYDEDAAERAEMREALEQVKDTIETAILELEAVKQNFLKREYTTMQKALEEIRDKLREGIEDDD